MKSALTTKSNQSAQTNGGYSNLRQAEDFLGTTEQQQLIAALKRIANALEKQNELMEDSAEALQRVASKLHYLGSSF